MERRISALNNEPITFVEKTPQACCFFNTHPRRTYCICINTPRAKIFAESADLIQCMTIWLTGSLEMSRHISTMISGRRQKHCFLHSEPATPQREGLGS